MASTLVIENALGQQLYPPPGLEASTSEKISYFMRRYLGVPVLFGVFGALAGGSFSLNPAGIVIGAIVGVAIGVLFNIIHTSGMKTMYEKALADG